MTFFAGDFLTADLMREAFAEIFSNLADYDEVASAQATTSATFVDLTTVGPEVTLTSVGTRALAIWSATQFSTVSATTAALMGVEVSGDTVIAADAGKALVDESSSAGNAAQSCQFAWLTINPGENTYTCKYRSETGGTSVSHSNRRLLVIAP